MLNLNKSLSIFTFFREQGTGNREQGTGNREQGTGNREQGAGEKFHSLFFNFFLLNS
jgi:hypothetical protein